MTDPQVRKLGVVKEEKRGTQREAGGRDEDEENDEVQEENGASGKTGLVLELIKRKVF